ncbi:hypothetical protein [Gloeocapsa sp. PCC 73106]|uniref:hypothetical protein n=1 Tax=Gloeocapsa sp. PCC 73106 TaxID=102232 RepID=UPI0002AC08FC|nr:hypothetical protein [Gloeocapsa sp. PCC 73106]ELR98070.1 hypothetical protein GLO73106DRAFT_00018920 [Gloeocapsa sp. PCC 73106]
MDVNFFEEYQKQLNQWQKEFFETWLNNFTGTENQLNFSDSIDKTLSFQQAFVETTLKNQKLAIETTISTQEKLWENYFEMLRKMTALQTEQNKA